MRRQTAAVPLLMTVLYTLAAASAAAQPLHRTGTQWAPYLQWAFHNPAFDGNPFDLIATATFVHQASGEERTTQMFYDGDNTWKLRFTGTRTGLWTFTTASDDPDLDGKRGKVTILPNPDSNITGFLTTKGTKFALQVGQQGELRACRFNVFMDRPNFDALTLENFRDPDFVDRYLQSARRHGFDIIFVHVNNNWFKLGARSHRDHESQNPDPETFRILESVITRGHRQGGRVQIWAWGDEARKWTPIGVGGINGVPDKRLQRYIAARLGPLPGWTMGYGFDLQEWVNEDQLAQWADYMHRHLGWQHLLWGRGRSNPKLDVISYSGPGLDTYDECLETMATDPDRPHFFEERFTYTRWDKYDMDTTRRHLWWYTMAGGIASWWGRFPDSPAYPNPEQLRTVAEFWRGRFLLDVEPANDLSDGYCLKSANNARYIFYKEDADAIRMDLTDMKAPQAAVAVDTKKEYAEINLHTLAPGRHTWTAPYPSDWALALGAFPARKP